MGASPSAAGRGSSQTPLPRGSRQSAGSARSAPCRSGFAVAGSAEQRIDGGVDATPWKRLPGAGGRRLGRSRNGEQALNSVGQEARRLAVAVRVGAALPAVVVANRNVYVQPAARSRQRDVEQAPLLGDSLLARGAHIGREVAVVG